MLPKGILFDLDDTIIAYGVIAGPIWKSVCEAYAGRSGIDDPARLFKAIDDVRKWYWSVGDNLEWDVRGPQKLGIHGIWHDVRGAGLPESSDILPDRIIKSIAEIIETG